MKMNLFLKFELFSLMSHTSLLLKVEYNLEHIVYSMCSNYFFFN